MMSDVTRVPRGFIDADGWVRFASGAPVSREDACGTLPAHLPSPTNQHEPRTVVPYPLAPLTSKYSYKFFHWVVESLPRLALLLQAEPSLRQRWRPPSDTADGSSSVDSIRLLVSCKGKPIRESLALLGVDRSRVLCWRPGREYSTRAHLLWPSPAPCGGARRTPLRLLRTAIMPPMWRPLGAGAATASSGSTSLPHPLLYSHGAIVLHRRLGTRKLANHAAIESALRAFPGLSSSSSSSTATATSPLGNAAAVPLTVLNGSEGLRAQVAAVRASRCQIGPHGAGFALMVFAPAPWFGTGEITPGAYFVSIAGKPGVRDPTTGYSLHLNRGRNRTSKWVSHPTPNACYKGLSATLGMRHEWVVVPGATANEDLEPDVRQVVAMATRVCTPPR